MVIVINKSDKQAGLYLGGGGGCIWNVVSVSTCGGLIHRGLIFGVLIFGGLR